MKRNLILTPGPTHVPPHLCAALGRPIIHHRTPQYQQYLKEVDEGLKYVFQTQNDVYIIASSGTGAMDAAVCNFFSPGDKVITVEGGKFGERWTEICKAYGLEPHIMAVPWGKTVDPAAVQAVLKKDPDIKAIFTTLCETSTGVRTDIEALGKMIAGTDTLLIVDAVSGLGAMDLKTDTWGVDVVAAASHKGLMLPPGLGFIAVSPKAAARMESATCPKYYLNLRAYKKAYAKTDTPYTSAINLVVALTESLKFFKEKGLDHLFGHYARLARGTRAAAKALGLSLLADEGCCSNAVTAINIPQGVDGIKLVKLIRDTYGITMAGGQAQLKGKIVRIAHMGSLDEYDMLTGIAVLEKALKEMGYFFQMGAGLAAAQAVFTNQ